METIGIKKLIKNTAEENQEKWDKNLEEESKKNENDWYDFTTSLYDTSELKVHKILYFLYGYFWQKYKKDLFEPNFESWKHGPVEINYREYNKMDLNYENQEQLKSLKYFCFSLIKYNVWTLVEFSHITEPWKNAGSGLKVHEKIKKEDIRKYFESLKN